MLVNMGFSPVQLRRNVRLLHLNNETSVAYTVPAIFERTLRYGDNYSPEIELAVTNILPAKTISIDNIGETDYVIAWFDDTHDTELDYTYYHDVYFGYSEINLIEELEHIIEKGFNPLEEDVEGFRLKSSIESVSKEDFVRFIKEKVLALQKVSFEELGDLSAYHTTWERDEEGNIIPVPDKIHIPEEIQPKSVDGEGIQDWSNIRIAKINLDIYGGANGFPYAWTVRTQFVKEKTL